MTGTGTWSILQHSSHFVPSAVADLERLLKVPTYFRRRATIMLTYSSPRRLALLCFGAALVGLAQATAPAPGPEISQCPVSCAVAGLLPAAWTNYHDTSFLAKCNDTSIFDLNIYNSLDRSNSNYVIRACSVGGSNVTAPSNLRGKPIQGDSRDDSNGQSICPSSSQSATTNAELQFLHWNATTVSGAMHDLQAASESLVYFLSDSTGPVGMKPQIVLVRTGTTLIGVYIGAAI
ncbi:hypothetical protein K461DRAFT_293142 [Myriangium duriaei CBS 260.36]|uniref:Uncharacterized protein n=1 Tax=Myriangium duriaei CBS 260.36 TaxID=1168546 RepID=A0A9P4J3L8_9PEZI|nr:hypothetical protein K461DRAFT_293142 [Myriangium duriaei CBS 260.36]